MQNGASDIRRQAIPKPLIEYARPQTTADSGSRAAAIVPAIVGVVWGAVTMLYALPQAIACAMLLFGNDAASGLVWRGPLPTLGWIAYLNLLTTVTLGLGSLQLVGSIACLRWKNWGRRCLIVWAWGMFAGMVIFWVNDYIGWKQYHPPWNRGVLWVLLFQPAFWNVAHAIVPVWIIATFKKPHIKSLFSATPHSERTSPSDMRFRIARVAGVIGVIWSALLFDPQVKDLSWHIADIFGPSFPDRTRELLLSGLSLAALVLLFLGSTRCLVFARRGKWLIVIWALVMAIWTGWAISAISRDYGASADDSLVYWNHPYHTYRDNCRVPIRFYDYLTGKTPPLEEWDPLETSTVGIFLLIGYFCVILLLGTPIGTAHFWASTRRFLMPPIEPVE